MFYSDYDGLLRDASDSSMPCESVRLVDENQLGSVVREGEIVRYLGNRDGTGKLAGWFMLFEAKESGLYAIKITKGNPKYV